MAYLAIGTLPLTQTLTFCQEVLLHAFQRCLRPASHVCHHRADCMLHKTLKLQAFAPGGVLEPDTLRNPASFSAFGTLCNPARFSHQTP